MWINPVEVTCTICAARSRAITLVLGCHQSGSKDDEWIGYSLSICHHMQRSALCEQSSTDNIEKHALREQRSWMATARGHMGVVYPMNHGPFRALLKPLVVGPSYQGVMAVCNIADSVPTLVSKVGDGASVVVFVQNSGNLGVLAGQRIVLSEPMLHPLISGLVGERAGVTIHTIDRDNVLLRNGASLSVENGMALVTTLLHTSVVRSSDCMNLLFAERQTLLDNRRNMYNSLKMLVFSIASWILVSRTMLM